MENGRELYEKYKGCIVNNFGKVVGFDSSGISLIVECVGGWSEIEEDDTIMDNDNIGTFTYLCEVLIESLRHEPLQEVTVEINTVEGGQRPIASTREAAGFDVFAREIIKVNDYYYKVKLGITSKMSPEYYAELCCRSSITDTGWGMANSEGIIDADFEHEWQARFRPFKDNVRDWVFPYKVGDRVAQFIIKKKEDVLIKGVDYANEERKGGHGSTGK